MNATLRAEIRSVIGQSAAPKNAMSDAWMRGHDLTFTKLLAAHGLIGLTWPVELGGRQASNLDRLVVTEELLRVGAPVAAHWIADRQIGPAILRHGSARLQREFLPRIAAGDVTFCLGMSETESGSDLAAVRTRAVLDGDNFRITGNKIWTSHAHRSTHAYVLARTGNAEAKHGGLTEFVVDLATPGIEIRPIHDLAGEHHFNEMIFTDVVVPAGNVIGEIDGGWRQVTEQLAFERGGMERVLSTYPLLAAVLNGEHSDLDQATLGELMARLHTLRAIAYRIARAMDEGHAPIQQAALLKYLGTSFEGDVVDYVRGVLALSPSPDADGIEGLLARSIVALPGATIRGGTTEVLLTIVGRQELSAKGAPRIPTGTEELREAVADVLRDQRRGAAAAELGATWSAAVELGWTGIGTPEGDGGSGGDVRDLAVVATELAYSGRSAPIVETAIAARTVALAGRPVDVSSPMTVGLAAGITCERRAELLVLNGRQSRVGWARAADAIVLTAAGEEGELLLLLPLRTAGVSIEAGTNLAGEPRDTLVLNEVSLPASAILGDSAAVVQACNLSTAMQCAAILGALRAAHGSARQHVLVREQFGKPLAAFQAVAHNVARMAAEVVSTEVAVEEALAELAAAGPGWRIAAGRVIAARAAGTVARIAHQLLGAMGITKEHDLHVATLSLWSWRDEGTAERTLARRLGQAATSAGRDTSWDWCVQESRSLDRDPGRSPWREN